MKALISLIVASILFSEAFSQTPGMLDPNFNTTGYSVNDISGNNQYDGAVGISVIPGTFGGYFVAGTTEGSSGNRIFGLAKYATDGSLQNTSTHLVSSSDIGLEARACTRKDFSGGTGYCIAGRVETASGNQGWHVAAFNDNLDLLSTSFGQGGWVNTFWVDDTITDVLAMAALQDGKLVLAGYVDDNIALVRHTITGPLDNTFSSDGKVEIAVPNMTDARATGIAIAGNGDIFVTGYGVTDGNFLAGTYHGFIAKLTSNGALDLSWGTNGFVKLAFWQIGFPPGEPSIMHSVRLMGIQIDADGKLLVHGEKALDDGLSTNWDWNFFVARRLPDGTADGTFGTSGSTSINFPANGFNRDIASAMVVQPDGRIVLVGASGAAPSASSYLGSRIALARLETNGTLDVSFGTAGKVETDLPGSTEFAKAARMHLSSIVVVGSTGTSSSELSDFVILRYLTGPLVGILEFAEAANEVVVYPNPLNEATTFQYTLAKNTQLSIALHDMQGREVATFMQAKYMPAGEHVQTVAIPADLASGDYLVIFSSPEGRCTVQVTK